MTDRGCVDRVPGAPAPLPASLTMTHLVRTGAAVVAIIAALAATAAGLRPELRAGAVVAVALTAALVAALALLLRLTGTWSFPHRRLGTCNVVTVFRGGLACLLTMPLAAPGVAAEPEVAWTIVGVGTVAVALDGVDGWLARREGVASRFGARLDMEVDAFLALVLALLAHTAGAAGAVVLVLGLARYAFALSRLALPWLRAPLPERFSRKVICVAQLSVLLVLQAPVVPDAVAGPLATLAAVLLIGSFARDITLLSPRIR